MIRAFNGHQFLLTKEKVLVHQSSNTGFIADVHLGKSTHFRKAGIAIPSNILAVDLAHLEEIIQQYALKELYFLGDLFHSTLNSEWNTFLSFIAKVPDTKFFLVKGNHDILPENAYESKLLNVNEEPLSWQDFILTHHPMEQQVLQQDPDQFNLAGHIHPGVIIRGKARSSLKVACYLEKQQQLILPAFGRFTGLSLESTKGSTKAYMIGSKEVFEIS